MITGYLSSREYTKEKNMRFVLSLVAIVLAFVIGIFAEHDFSLIDHTKKRCHGQQVVKPQNCDSCTCNTCHCSSCKCCKCCKACKTRGAVKCDCENCDCCSDCPGHKHKKKK
jgi:hypothetical protein